MRETGTPDYCCRQRTSQAGQDITASVQNVTDQAALVSNAVKEQTQGVEDIIKGIDNAREQMRQVTATVKEQAKQGQNIVTA